MRLVMGVALLVGGGIGVLGCSPDTRVRNAEYDGDVEKLVAYARDPDARYFVPAMGAILRAAPPETQRELLDESFTSPRVETTGLPLLEAYSSDARVNEAVWDALARRDEGMFAAVNASISRSCTGFESTAPAKFGWVRSTYSYAADDGYDLLNRLHLETCPPELQLALANEKVGLARRAATQSRMTDASLETFLTRVRETSSRLPPSLAIEAAEIPGKALAEILDQMADGDLTGGTVSRTVEGLRPEAKAVFGKALHRELTSGKSSRPVDSAEETHRLHVFLELWLKDNADTGVEGLLSELNAIEDEMRNSPARREKLTRLQNEFSDIEGANISWYCFTVVAKLDEGVYETLVTSAGGWIIFQHPFRAVLRSETSSIHRPGPIGCMNVRVERTEVLTRNDGFEEKVLFVSKFGGDFDAKEERLQSIRRTIEGLRDEEEGLRRRARKISERLASHLAPQTAKQVRK